MEMLIVVMLGAMVVVGLMIVFMLHQVNQGLYSLGSELGIELGRELASLKECLMEVQASLDHLPETLYCEPFEPDRVCAMRYLTFEYGDATQDDDFSERDQLVAAGFQVVRVALVGTQVDMVLVKYREAEETGQPATDRVGDTRSSDGQGGQRVRR
jgi:hypothetical protein